MCTIAIERTNLIIDIKNDTPLGRPLSLEPKASPKLTPFLTLQFT